MVAAEEEKKFEEKSTPTGDDLQERKETELAEDPSSSSSSIGISLVMAGGLVTSEQLAMEEQYYESKATASSDRSQKGQHLHFNVDHSKKGSY